MYINEIVMNPDMKIKLYCSTFQGEQEVHNAVLFSGCILFILEEKDMKRFR